MGHVGPAQAPALRLAERAHFEALTTVALLKRNCAASASRRGMQLLDDKLDLAAQGDSEAAQASAGDGWPLWAGGKGAARGGRGALLPCKGSIGASCASCGSAP